ncbi:hypothetical protein [Psychroserpens sp.]|uniref:hypothetical protein n=1 Tax=Psychroserpens sp. TaxID=2020870 RepID=UPI001B0946AC|nr:hypothetical protein [Psychroserpens sp.]MBO6606650.1 hypothetical protein [Psychroserpens sp.]MBO6631888.1 hypothetical protein [Psychroserpens sp.]MBO6653354.1 hypothetical protein [Psychroserpens sp.]MBO6680619.1 hypothetical protein [Psychroserpens sp.]MBO6750423.1 hypothetical protein [Psychroserpens sp.]
MDDVLIKLMLLIVPAVFTVLVITLSPVLEAKKFKNRLLGTSLTVIINHFDEDYNEIELYRTEGTIEDIADGVVAIKRKTQPNFKIPFVRSDFLDSKSSKARDRFTSVVYVDSERDFDPNHGIFIDVN